MTQNIDSTVQFPTINTSSSASHFTATQSTLATIKVRSEEEIEQVIEILRQNIPVVVNLASLNPDLAKRAINWLLGGTYALDGQSLEIDSFIFLFSPRGVKVTPPATSRQWTQPTKRKPTANLKQKAPNTSSSSFKEVDLGAGVTLLMRLIPAGVFEMGSPSSELERSTTESPQHQVRVDSFWLSQFPITQIQWQRVTALPKIRVSLNPYPSHFFGENRPVEQINWDEAVEFCARLSQLTGEDYRLPSEAEWEYACRGKTTTAFWFGETINSQQANYDDSDDEEIEENKIIAYRQQTNPVGKVGKANIWGLFDLHGNVWEWCADNWHESYQNAPTDGKAWLSPLNEEERPLRVLRGGSWYDAPRFCRSASRYALDPQTRSNDVGFRVVSRF